MGKKKKLKYDVGLVNALVEGPAAGALSDWLYRGQGSIADLEARQAATVIEAATRLEKAERVAAAQAQAGSKRVRKFAARAAHKLRSTGIDVPDPQQGGSWSLGQEQIEVPPPLTMLGFPEPEGGVPFLIVAFGRNESVLFAGMASGAVGSRDAWHRHMGRSEARNVAWDVRKNHGLHQVPPHVALHFLGRAFQHGDRSPHEWDHLTGLVDDGLLRSARILDPLSKQPDDIDEAALRNVDPMLEPDLSLVFAMDESVAMKATTALLQAVTSELELDDTSRTRRIKAELDDAADASMDDVSRQNWIFALDVVTAIAADNGDEDLAACARATALAMREGRAGRDIPFVRAWIEKQLATITEMISGLEDRGKDALQEMIQVQQMAAAGAAQSQDE